MDCGASDQRAHPWPVDTAGPHHFIVMVIEAKLAEASRFVPLPEVAHSEVRSAAIPLRGNLILNRAPFFLVGPQANSSAAAVNCASDWIYSFFKSFWRCAATCLSVPPIFVLILWSVFP